MTQIPLDYITDIGRIKDYTDKILKLKRALPVFFRLVSCFLNLEEFRKRYTTKQILDLQFRKVAAAGPGYFK